MKGKISRETAAVAKVILRKNGPGNRLLLAYTREFRLTGVGVPAKWPTMLAPVLEKLLILQDRDAKRLGLEAQLKAVPKDIAAVEQKIAAEKAAIETAKHELMGWNRRKSSWRPKSGRRRTNWPNTARSSRRSGKTTNIRPWATKSRPQQAPSGCWKSRNYRSCTGSTRRRRSSPPPKPS